MTTTQTDSDGVSDELQHAADILEQHSHVEKVERCWNDDGAETDDLMVILDWVTESHMEGSTRIHDETNYDGHTRKVRQAIRDLEGVEVTYSNSRLNGYCYFVGEAQERWS